MGRMTHHWKIVMSSNLDSDPSLDIKTDLSDFNSILLLSDIYYNNFKSTKVFSNKWHLKSKKEILWSKRRYFGILGNNHILFSILLYPIKRIKVYKVERMNIGKISLTNWCQWNMQMQPSHKVLWYLPPRGVQSGLYVCLSLCLVFSIAFWQSFVRPAKFKLTEIIILKMIFL